MLYDDAKGAEEPTPPSDDEVEAPPIVDPPTLAATVSRLGMLRELGTDNVVLGMANLQGALCLLLPMLSGVPRAELHALIGAAIDSAPAAFKDPHRAFAALTAADVDFLLTGTPTEAFWASMDCVRALLAPNVEEQVNALVEPILGEAPFAPGSLAPPPGERVLFVLLAAEALRLKWDRKFGAPQDGLFTTSDGESVPARYAWDSRRRLEHLVVRDAAGPLGTMVKVPARADGRSMLLLLPTTEDTSLDDCLAALRAAVLESAALPWAGAVDVDIRFPCLDTGPLVPHNLTAALASRAPAIFSPGALDDVLPPERIADGRQAILSKVLHGASLTVDHAGATAKAVTAVVAVRRSTSTACVTLPARVRRATLTARVPLGDAQNTFRSAGFIVDPLLTFHCDRPFVLFIAKGDHLEFGLKVTDGRTFDVARTGP